MQRSVLSLAAAAALALTGLAAPAAVAAPAQPSVAQYAGSAAEQADVKAFHEAVMKSALARQAANPYLLAVTVTYNAASAPTFRTQIANSTAIWNGAVTKVQLRSVTGTADFKYYEGNDSRGSYASTNGHGSGYIFLDYRQNQQYNSTRVTAHETGHVLGLPDHYSGPCSELMSGGGPGTSCTNPNPNAAERNRVNQLWANGLTAFKAQLAAKSGQ
ncbi:snapalysin [Kitasatospora sp. NPDC096147]|uniref:snapalysin n=1 Tax=Kitasatospora sp. NPDC096147 TaxID=3364093 RepID=UPI0037FBC159